jgi:exodeoxyribonuclease-3
MTKVVTWNVNSIKARLPRVSEWLKAAKPDVVLLQETKCEDASFPRAEIEELGYNFALCGQKTYNGVAILSKSPIEDVACGLPGGDGDAQSRYIEAFTCGLRVASIYLPNGNPVDSDKFPYKLAWLDRLARHAETLLAHEEKLVMGGDYNVCPTDSDVYDPVGWADDALCRLESRKGFRKLLYLGFTDAWRAQHPQTHAYSFWDYQGGAWQKDHGLRIDHLLLSPQAADRLKDSGIDRGPRGKEKASDHTPVWAELDD